MIKLLEVFRSLCGGGVCLRVENNKVSLSGDDILLNQVDLSAIKKNRALIINALPHGVDLTAQQITDGIEAYIERAAIMEYYGGLSRVDAEAKAFWMLRRYIIESL